MRLRIATVVLVLLFAVSCQAAGPTPVGSLTSYGGARLSGVVVPTGAAVFPGDIIESDGSKTILTLTGGDSVLLGVNARVKVTQSGAAPAIEVLQGVSRVHLRSREVRVLASNWSVRGTPDAKSGLVTADIVRDSSGKTSINVKEGELVASRGQEVAVAAAGRPILLPAAAAPPAPQKAPAPAGATKGKASAATVGAFVIGGAAIAVGAAALATRDNDQAKQAQLLAQAAQTQAAQNAQAAQTAQQQAAAAQAAAAAAAAQAAAAQAAAAAAQAAAAAAQQALANFVAADSACATAPGSTACANACNALPSPRPSFCPVVSPSR